MRQYPVGKAQQMALDALELTAAGSADAEKIFERLGLVVASKRQGRKSVPSITRRDTETGGMHNGDGWSQEIEFDAVDFSKIAQWMN